MRMLPMVATAAELPDRIATLAQSGITEIAFGLHLTSRDGVRVLSDHR